MKIELPQVGESVTEGVIGRWLKNVGDKVEKYDPLVEVITDKVNMELPSPVEGVLREIIANEGDTVPMGGLIADIETKESENSPINSDTHSNLQEENIGTTGVLIKDAAPVGPTGSGGPISQDKPQPDPSIKDRPKSRYSPAVLRLAEENNIDLEQVVGTGINGRITRKDVTAFIESKPNTLESQTIVKETAASTPRQDQEKITLSPIRRMIAANMVKSATLIPQAWSEVAVDVT